MNQPVISDDDLRLIASLQYDLVLALVLANGQLAIRVADANHYPGHTAWIERDKITSIEVQRAFSLIVKDGSVTGFFPTSELNPSATSYSLNEEEIGLLLAVLPLAVDLKMYR